VCLPGRHPKPSETAEILFCIDGKEMKMNRVQSQSVRKHTPASGRHCKYSN
jgi:hypothetical protein